MLVEFFLKLYIKWVGRGNLPPKASSKRHKSGTGHNMVDPTNPSTSLKSRSEIISLVHGKELAKNREAVRPTVAYSFN